MHDGRPIGSGMRRRGFRRSKNGPQRPSFDHHIIRARAPAVAEPEEAGATGRCPLQGLLTHRGRFASPEEEAAAVVVAVVAVAAQLARRN